MLRWKPRQRAVLVSVLPGLANLGYAALVLGPVISQRPLPGLLMAIGFTQWLLLVGVTLAIAGVDEP